MADCDQLLNGDKGPLLQLVEKIFNHTAGANRALDPYEVLCKLHLFAKDERVLGLAQIAKKET